MSTNFIKKFTLILLFFLVKTNFCLAWSGFNYKNGEEIEISSGNLVREGEEIKFYDWQSGEERRAEVLSVENALNFTKLGLYDLTEKKERIFEMDNFN